MAFATLTVVRRRFTVCGCRKSHWNATKAVATYSTFVRKLELGLLEGEFLFHHTHTDPWQGGLIRPRNRAVVLVVLSP